MSRTLTRRNLVTGALASPLLATAKSRSQPNVLLICTDQQRYDTIAALGNKHINTPHLDSLVRQGVTFTHATTSCPVCAPARWGIQTGQWTTTHRCYSNHDWPGSPPPEHTAGMLRRAGYRTALVGKNHTYLRAGDFDVFEYPREVADAPGWRERDRWMKGAEQKYPRLFEEGVPGGPEADPMRAVTNRSLEFIDSTGEKPFFLFTSYLHPHTPYYAPEPFFRRYARRDLPPPVVEPEGLAKAGKPFRQVFHQRNNDTILPFDERQMRLMKSVYYAMVSQIDAEIGLLLKHLRDRGLEKHTRRYDF